MLLSEAITKYGDIDTISELPHKMDIVDLQCLESVARQAYELACAKEKPELKKIDMSRCIESAIDCEFCDQDEADVRIEKLMSIHGGNFYDPSEHWDYCHPRMNHIHACPVGFDESPLPEGFKIKIYRRDGNETKGLSVDFATFNQGREYRISKNDIIAFEVTGIADGWEL